MPAATRRPLIVCAGARTALSEVEQELGKRYVADYEVKLATSGDSAIELVRAAVEQGRQIAVVIADEALHDPTGIDVLDHARELSPTTRRALLVEPASVPVADAALRAARLGAIHGWLMKPTALGLVEEFHHTIGDLLYGWSNVNRRFEWVRVIGEASSPATHEVRDLLARNRVPFGFYDAAHDEGRRLLDELGTTGERLPVLAVGDGEVLVQPSVSILAGALGGATRPRSTEYDVVVIGAGPAGLGAAMYAASEGLRTLVVEREAIGGRAGTSSLIRNYLGFPMGISGSELALRAFHQALFFGVEFVFANQVAALDEGGRDRVVALSDGTEVGAPCVVIASGVSYRRLAVPQLEERIGAGVYYGAGTTEAEAMSGRRVCVVGGGNSAGQAALKLAEHAEHVTMAVRGTSLADSMSDYLIKELGRARRVAVRFNTEVVAGEGEPTLKALTLRDVESGREEALDATGLFVLIGAEPTTAWLPPSLQRDRWGYLLTGTDIEHTPGASPRPTQFETSVPGVFAVGDVRHGSAMRVAAAVGEGAVCARLVFQRSFQPDVA